MRREFVYLYPNVEMFWSSTRETINIFQADETAAISSPWLTTCWANFMVAKLLIFRLTCKMFLQDTTRRLHLALINHFQVRLSAA
jgi:hypothetical protein